MKKQFMRVTGSIILLMLANVSWARFGMLIPSDTMVMQDDTPTLNITLSFSHPFEMVGMELGAVIWVKFHNWQ